MAYSAMFAYRRGRTVYIGDRSTTGDGCCWILLYSIILIGIPLGCWLAEKEFHDRMVAFHEVENHITSSDRCGRDESLKECMRGLTSLYGSKWPVHVSVDGLQPSRSISGSVTDDEFGVKLDDALHLERHTEYCQWQQTSTDVCQTCSREVNGKTESYSCNCVRTYHYHKSWIGHRVNSLLFDQPGTHHNPQRDPFPSKTIVSKDAKIGDIALHPSLFKNAHSELRAKSMKVDWTRRGIREPRFYDSILTFFGFQLGAGVRYEDVERLKHHPESLAARKERFTYVGNGGYFYSPYEADRYTQLFKVFAQVVEGSILDFQIGDFMPSCTAGDIRVSYNARSPFSLSVVAGLVSPGAAEDVALGLYRTSTGYELGLAHEGVKSAYDVFSYELWDAKSWCLWWRAGSLLWAHVVASAVAAACGRRFADVLTHAATVVGCAGALLGLMWGSIWGVEMGADSHELVTPLLLVVSAGLVYQAVQVSEVIPNGRKGLEGVWDWVRYGGYPPQPPPTPSTEAKRCS